MRMVVLMQLIDVPEKERSKSQILHWLKERGKLSDFSREEYVTNLTTL